MKPKKPHPRKHHGRPDLRRMLAPPPARLLRPLQRLLGLEAPEAAQAVALSWLGGYAVSAQLAGRLYGAHRISRRDARRLLLLGCCSGPG